jgi:hypothetical protein
LSEFYILCGNRSINGKHLQLSDLPSEFADHPCNGRWGLSYLPKKVFRLVKDKDVYGITGVVGCFLNRQTVKRNLALSSRTKIQYDREVEAHAYLLKSCAAAKRHNGGGENHFDSLKTGVGYKRLLSPKTKKADVAEHPKVFDHVGLLFNKSPGKAELLFV